VRKVIGDEVSRTVIARMLLLTLLLLLREICSITLDGILSMVDCHERGVKDGARDENYCEEDGVDFAFTVCFGPHSRRTNLLSSTPDKLLIE